MSLGLRISASCFIESLVTPGGCSAQPGGLGGSGVAAGERSKLTLPSCRSQFYPVCPTDGIASSTGRPRMPTRTHAAAVCPCESCAAPGPGLPGEPEHTRSCLRGLTAVRSTARESGVALEGIRRGLSSSWRSGETWTRTER